MGETYYARRSARDPAWRDAQIAAAMERERRRREADPDYVRDKATGENREFPLARDAFVTAVENRLFTH